MKRIHLIVLLAIVLAAAVMQWQGVRTRAREADLRQEVTTLEMRQTNPQTTPSTGNPSATSTQRNPRTQNQPDLTKNSQSSQDAQWDTVRLTKSIAQGDLAEATRIFCVMQKDDPQRWALAKLMEAVTTQEDQRLVLEQAGKSAASPTFLLLAQALGKKSTFDANLNLLSRATLTPEKYDLAAAAIAGAKIDNDTADRAAWLLQTLKTDQNEPITHFAASWTEGDFRAANTWMNSLPPGLTRDAAVLGFAPIAARIDGASAVDWALTISDPAQRKSSLDSVTKTWKSREPEAASAYLQEKGIEDK